MATTETPRAVLATPYAEACFGGGRLTRVDSIPLLVVTGRPEEMGHQVAELALRPGVRLLDYPLDYIRGQIRIPVLPRLLWALMRRQCGRLYRNVPEPFRVELEAMAERGFDRRRLVAANTLFDMAHMGLRPLFGCSSWVALPGQSETGSLLFGRNLDFFPLGYLHDYSLVTVYRPAEGRLGFASLGFPGVVGCFSGMNEAGLCLARNEVFTPRVKTTYNPDGVPFATAFRGVLETCRTVPEALAAIERTPHVTVNNLVVCDARGGAIVEIAPEGVKSRPVTPDVRACTNHFTHPDWQNPAQANSFRTRDRLGRLDAGPVGGRLGVEDIRRGVDQVHQGELTIQTMVFEPAAGAVHVAFGPGPTTQRPMARIELARYWA